MFYKGRCHSDNILPKFPCYHECVEVPSMLTVDFLLKKFLNDKFVLVMIEIAYSTNNTEVLSK